MRAVQSALCILAVVAPVILAEPGGAQAGAPALVLKVGLMTPLTGPLASLGPSMQNAMLLAVEDVNAESSLTGLRIDVVGTEDDTTTDQSQAAAAYDRLVGRGASAIVGPCCSGITGSILAKSVSDRVIVISPSATSPTLTATDRNDFFWRVSPTDVGQGRALAQLVAAEGAKKANLIVVNNDYGNGFAGIFQQEFQSKGGAVGTVSKADETSTTLASQVAEACAGSPNAVVMVVYTTQGAEILKAMQSRGCLSKVKVYASEGVYSPFLAGSVVELAGKDSSGAWLARGMKGTTPYSFDTSQFARKYEARYRAGPAQYAAESYDAVAYLALSTLAALSSDNAEIAFKFLNVVNPPGTRCSAFKECAAQIKQGVTINYDAYAHDLQYTTNNGVFEPISGAYSAWEVAVDGSMKINVDRMSVATPAPVSPVLEVHMPGGEFPNPRLVNVGERFSFTLTASGATIATDHIGAHYGTSYSADPSLATYPNACEHQPGSLPGRYTISCTISTPGTYHMRGHIRVTSDGETYQFWSMEDITFEARSQAAASPTPTPSPATPSTPTQPTPPAGSGTTGSATRSSGGVSKFTLSSPGSTLVGATAYLLAERGGVLVPTSHVNVGDSGVIDIDRSAVSYLAFPHRNGVDVIPLPSGEHVVVPDRVSGSLANLTPAQKDELGRTFKDAKLVELPDARSGVPARIELAGYAGIDHLMLEVDTQQSVRLAIARFDSKPLADVPDPRATPNSWFGLHLSRTDGEDATVRRVEVVFARPSDADSGQRVVLNHLDSQTGVWSEVVAEAQENGLYRASVSSFSLFAISTRAPTPFELAQPWLLPAFAGLVLMGAAGYAAAKIAKRPRRSRPLAPPPAAPPVATPAASALEMAVEPSEPRKNLSGEFAVSDLSVSVDGKALVEGVSFGFGRGSILALLGPSGCGKSTTLKALIGEISHTGEIDVFGLNPRRDRAALKTAIGYVSQETQLYPEMTVAENVDYFAQQYGVPKKERKSRVTDLLRVLGIEDRADERLRVLSGGQQRRASIAATLVHQPALLILDEPTSGLDPTTRRNLWKFIRQARDELGVSIIVTTHFLDEAALADQVVIMNRGRVVATGAPESLISELPGGGKAVVVELTSVNAQTELRIRTALAPLLADGTIEKIDIAGYGVRLLTRDPTIASRRALDVFHELNVSVRKFGTEECDLEDVFSHVTSESWKTEQ